jgi:hypothetical protein
VKQTTGGNILARVGPYRGWARARLWGWRPEFKWGSLSSRSGLNLGGARSLCRVYFPPKMDAPPVPTTKPPPVRHRGLGVLVAVLAVLLVVALGVLLFVALRPGGGGPGPGSGPGNGPHGNGGETLSCIPTPPGAFPRPSGTGAGACASYLGTNDLKEAYWSILFVKVFQKQGGGDYRVLYDGSGDRVRPSKSGGFFQWHDAKDPPNHSIGAFGPQEDLCSYSGGYTIIRAGASPQLRGIKFESTKLFDSGLFILAANHVPAGYGVWPAFWLTAAEPGGAKWACNGEIDILEYANDAGQQGKGTSISTLHTNVKPNGTACMQDGVPGVSDPDCGKGDPPPQGYDACGCDGTKRCPNLGCAVPMPGGPDTAGAGFNQACGGVFACELIDGGTKDGKITVWFWPQKEGAIPADIIANRPNPASWTTKRKISFNPCPGQFKHLRLVIDTKLCGDWGGAAFPDH